MVVLYVVYNAICQTASYELHLLSLFSTFCHYKFEIGPKIEICAPARAEIEIEIGPPARRRHAEGPARQQAEI